MDKNLKLLFAGLAIFFLSFILRAQNITSEAINNVFVIISLIVIVIPLSRMVFKKLK